MTPILSDTDIAWLAGLFEGEATFQLDTRSKTRYQVSTAPRLSMIDQDIIARVSKMVGKGKTYFSPSRLTVSGKKVYTVYIGDRETLSSLLPRLFPYFGERRRRQQRVQECLDALAAWELWYKQGGRSEMAKRGPRARAKKLSLPPSSPPLGED